MITFVIVVIIILLGKLFFALKKDGSIKEYIIGEKKKLSNLKYRITTNDSTYNCYSENDTLILVINN